MTRKEIVAAVEKVGPIKTTKTHDGDTMQDGCVDNIFALAFKRAAERAGR